MSLKMLHAKWWQFDADSFNHIYSKKILYFDKDFIKFRFLSEQFAITL